jgi:carbamoyltransferase
VRILGVSGLANAVKFKSSHWPSADIRELRISQGHDSAAALVTDGRLVAAAAEERFNLKKHTGDLPAGAIRYCLAESGLNLEDIDLVVHAFDYSPYQEVYNLDPVSAELYRTVFSREALLQNLQNAFPGLPESKVEQIPHHLAHASSAFLTSGWDECLVIVIDAMGETQSVTVYHADKNGLDEIKKISANDSIGIFYSLVTLHLGFDFNADEYKIMGLAPYGDPSRFRSFFEEAVELYADGTVRIPPLRLNQTREERENYLATRRFLTERLLPARSPEENITQTHRDVAAALQECLNKVILHICGHFGSETGLRRLALAGGVALNCTANGSLMRSGTFDEIYVQPAAGDDGAAVGAALYGSWANDSVRNIRMPVPFYCPAYSAKQIDADISQFADEIVVVEFESLEKTCQEAARLIAQGCVIAWYRGRMDFGPRALGNRSILADPGNPAMRDRINAMVKKREAFRPFAPAVSLEQVHLWFDVSPGTELPYMIATVLVREEYRKELPAITHVDGSARVQTVSEKDNPQFHRLLHEVGNITGCEMVLNTSFNVKGQPIVNSPKEAVETFLGTGIEYLFLENRLIQRRRKVRNVDDHLECVAIERS